MLNVGDCAPAKVDMVRARGLEPPLLAEPDPKSGVSAIPPRAQPIKTSLLFAIAFIQFVLDTAFVYSVFDLWNKMRMANRLPGIEMRPCPKMDSGAHFRMFHACCNTSATVIIMAESGSTAN